MSKKEKILIWISFSLNLLGIWGLLSGAISGAQPLVGIKWIAFALLVSGSALIAFYAYKFVKSAKSCLNLITDHFITYYPPISERIKALIENANYRFRRSTIRINYLNAEGTRVRISKDQEIIFLKDNVQHIWDGNITADAKQPGAMIDNNSFETSIGKIGHIKSEAGHWEVRTDLETTYQKGQRVNRKFSYIILNSYTQEEEHFVCSINKITEEVRIEVQVPSDVKILNCNGTLALGEFRVTFEGNQPQLDKHNRTITWILPNLKLGERYILRWTRTPIQAAMINKPDLKQKRHKKSKAKNN